MASVKLAQRYSKALIDLAIENKQLEDIHDDMQLLKVVGNESRDLRNMLNSPVVNFDKKKKILDLILRGRVNDLTLKFVELIVKKKRESALLSIADAFILKYKKLKGIATASLITAVELSQDVNDEVKSILKEKLNMNDVDLRPKVSADIIGGFVLHYEDKLYDASISGKLEELLLEFSKNTYKKV